MPDGRLQIFSNQPVPSSATPVKTVPDTSNTGVIQTSSTPQQQLLPKPVLQQQQQSPTKSTYTIQRNPNNVTGTPNAPIQPKPGNN